MAKSESKLQTAKKEAIKTANTETIVGSGYFQEDDSLKHYIRKKFWRQRIESLQRDSPSLKDGIKYFTFCSRHAFDIRYFQSNKLLRTNSPFAFVEFLKDDFNFLNDIFLSRFASTGATGFYGSLADISTTPSHEEYGRFWSTFPYDIINLDYLGDILKSNASSGKIGNNDFYSIQAIINQQALLRRPYELWITMRAKPGRYDPSIKQEFRKLINSNISEFDEFKREFKNNYNNKVNSDNLDDEHLFLIGYIKWICFICKTAFSSVSIPHLEVIKYLRTDKDGKDYYLYNLFLRIEPFDLTTIPSPASDAAQYCNTEYKKAIKKCFINPKDVGEDFKKLTAKERLILNQEIKLLSQQYNEDNSGYLS